VAPVRATLSHGRAWLALALAGALLPAASALAAHVGSPPVLLTAPEHAKRLLDQGEAPLFVDVRPPEDFRKAHLPGARSVPLAEFRRRGAELPRTGRVILYCACPLAEVQAAYAWLHAQGYRNVSVLDEGFVAWTRLGYPVERQSP
jgi:rhodanese-related sulfurtransferase